MRRPGCWCPPNTCLACLPACLLPSCLADRSPPARRLWVAAVVAYGVAPSDRYAVVPDSEPGADAVPQFSTVPEVPVEDEAAAAAVPDTVPDTVPDAKRLRV
jgi:hypothetical protein